MTLFGPDISSYQSGLRLSRLAVAGFVIAKTTEGTYYTDSDYQGWRAEAAQLGRPFIWYHFLSGEDVHAQAAHTAANVGDKSLPGMLDAEPAGSYTPTLAQILDYVDAAHAAGLNLRLVYLPRWVWAQMGSPSLSGLTERGVSLVSSQYPGGTGAPGSIYPGDKAPGWQPYGGLTPLIYQFTNKASDGGQSLDYNAYRGTSTQLVADLKAPTAPGTPTPASPSTDSEDDVSFATGIITPGLVAPGQGATTVVLPPPARSGGAGWGDVWFSLGSDNAGYGPADAHVRVAAFVGGVWTDFHVDFVVPSASARVFPFGGPLPTDVEKISITRLAGSENVPLSYLIEAVKR